MRGVSAQRHPTPMKRVRHLRRHGPPTNAPHVDVGEGVDVETPAGLVLGIPCGGTDQSRALLPREILFQRLKRREEGHLRDELAVAAKVVRHHRGDHVGVEDEIQHRGGASGPGTRVAEGAGEGWRGEMDVDEVLHRGGSRETHAQALAKPAARAVSRDEVVAPKRSRRRRRRREAEVNGDAAIVLLEVDALGGPQKTFGASWMRGEGARGELGLEAMLGEVGDARGADGSGSRRAVAVGGVSVRRMVLEVVDAAELNAADHARAVHEPAPVLEGGLRRRDRALQAEERAEHLVGSIVDEVRLRMRRGARAALDEEGVNAKAGEQDREGQTDGAAADDDHGNVRVAGGGGRRGGGARCRAGGREERRHAARAFGRPGGHEGRGERANRPDHSRHGDGARRRRRPRHLRARYAPSPPRQVHSRVTFKLTFSF